MTLKERLSHWPTNIEGLAWGAAAAAVINTLCPTLSATDPAQLIALIPVVRAALAGPQVVVAPTGTIPAPVK